VKNEYGSETLDDIAQFIHKKMQIQFYEERKNIGSDRSTIVDLSRSGSELRVLVQNTVLVPYMRNGTVLSGVTLY